MSVATKKPISSSKGAGPRIVVDEESKGFWEACQRGELVVQRCRACREIRFYPRALCPDCLSREAEWVRCSGRGTVYSFTVTHQNHSPAFRDRLPYVLAYVELEEGPRMLTNIVGCDPGDVKIDMPVEATFEKLPSGQAVVKFRPRTTERLR